LNNERRFVVSIGGNNGINTATAYIVNINEAGLPMMINVKDGEAFDSSLIEKQKTEMMDLLNSHQHLRKCMLIKAEGSQFELGEVIVVVIVRASCAF
jgi:hypothetical protein